MNRIAIDQGWQFKQTTKLNDSFLSDKYLPVSQFPTVVQLDLLHHGLIPDPYIGVNEPQNLWVGEADWEYKTSFSPPTDIGPGEKAELVFDGLDTSVDVYLNGEKILTAKDMFLAYRVDVTRILKNSKNGPAELLLKFHSNVKKARAERDRIGSNGRDWNINFGGSERLFLRKAQYHWGWDWGPVVNTSGPYRGIFLETYKERIEELQVVPDVAKNLDSAVVSLYGQAQGAKELQLEIKDPKGNLVERVAATVTDGNYRADITVRDPELWYPWMYGDQPLYTAVASTASGGHTVSKHFGIRRIRLVQKEFENEKGLSFYFEINNIDIFCGGSNWIPADVLPPRIKKEQYEKWVRLAKRGNHTMIRVWGGGYVEDEAFYNACDREGVLLWTDFQFACGNYPAKGDYLENVKEEIRQQVKLTNHHPSLVIYCGNNEDYLLADRKGWDWDRNNNDGPWDDTNFPARLIYEKVMPAICEELVPHIPYWRSSPYGGYYSNDVTIGDTHCWDIWNEQALPYQQYVNFSSRFISEFGYESPPNIRTIKYGIPDKSQQHSQSVHFDAHDKYTANSRRYAMYMAETIRFKMEPLEDYVYCTQWMQAEAMSYAVTLWRRRFKGPGANFTAGALIWQLNDIWPGQSWALLDMFYNPKFAYFTTKRALAQVFVGAHRVETEGPGYILRSYAPKKSKCDVWAVTTSQVTEDFELVAAAYNVQTGDKKPLTVEKRTVTLKPNRATELLEGLPIPDDMNTVVAVYLYNGNNEQVARFVNWPEPFKYLEFAKSPKITVDSSSQPGKVSVTTNVPLKGVYLHTSEDQDEADWEDNFIDMVPNETVTIKVSGLNGRKVLLKWLCHWETEPSIEYV